jgi:hypothetical protein
MSYKPKHIEPLHPPGVVAPLSEDQFRMGYMPQGQKYLFDLYATQSVKIAGTPMEFFSLDMRQTKANLIYGEARDKVWVGPYKLSGFVDWPKFDPEMKEEGLKFSAEAKSWISRQEFDDLKIYPKAGDVIRFWNVPYFNERSEAQGYFFNLTTVNDQGHLFDNPDFVGFALTIKRNTEFTPERRVIAPPNVKVSDAS